MEWWYAKEGAPHGPVDTDRLMALVSAGTLTVDARVWTHGMPDWCRMWQAELLQDRLRQVAPPSAPAPAAAPVASASLAAGGTPTAAVAGAAYPHEAGPWSRFVARQIDLVLFSPLLGFALALFLPGRVLLENDFAIGIVVLPVALVGDAVVLALFGTTPGKTLLTIRVRKGDGSRLSLLEALRRNLLLWVAGLGLGLPIIYLVTLYLSYRRVKAGLPCVWDEARMNAVRQRSIGSGRIWLAFLLLVVGFGLLMVIAAAAQYQGMHRAPF